MHPKAVNAYRVRVGAEVVNFRRAIVKIFRGHYYHERASIRIGADGEVTCSVKEFAPTKEEAAAMKEALQGIEFPRTVKARTLEGLKLKGETLQFIDRKAGLINMVQYSLITAKGTQSYLSWVILTHCD